MTRSLNAPCTRPTTTVGSVWVLPPQLSLFSGVTFEQALQGGGGPGGGGPGVTGAAEILLRASVAAYLDAALASLDRDTMLALATTLDKANNLGCPLN